MQRLSVCLKALICIAAPAIGQAQLPDSLRTYVGECVRTMQQQSLYAARVNWAQLHDSVNLQIQSARTTADAEATVISVFQKLKDSHGAYNGIDTSYRYPQPGAERVMSKGLLEPTGYPGQ